MASLHLTKQAVFKPLCLLTGFTITCSLPFNLPATAQIVPDNSLGTESSVVVPNVDINGVNSDRIDGGAIRGSNLFHSFQEFNIDDGRGAYFANPENISNILSRVTGNNLSNILGTLGVLGSANLFLINPNGIVFGPNARLDVGGSFFASTADSILFENGVEFAASNPDAPPLLTINMPLGLNIRENAGSIVSQSIAVDSEDNAVGLEVSPQKTLGFVGGNIQLEGGILTAPQGRIELGSVAGNGLVNLTPIDERYALNYENVPNFQDIALSQEAFVDAQGEGGGDIQIQGRRVTLTDGSVIEASTQGSAPGGILSIQASESVEVVGGGIFADVDPGATGEGGNLIIGTQRLLVQDGAFISASTFGNGNGGNLTVAATDVELMGINPNTQFPSILGASVQQGATGNAGNLTIDTYRLVVRDGARIVTTTFGNGNGGDLMVTATDVELVGRSGQFSSGLGAVVAPGAKGDAGTVSINTQRLLLSEGGQIRADTFGNGNAGNLNVTATDVELVGRSANGQSRSGLGASVQQGATGNGGTLTINTQRLSIQDSAFISTSTSGNGDGGDLTVTATNMELIGRSSVLGASALSGATGNGGTVTIDTQRLSLQDGAQIETSTFGNGDGGDLTVTATDIELVGTSADGFPSGLFVPVNSDAVGNGGNLTIDTQHLSVRDGANISASTFGNGDGGDITVTATDIELVGIAANGEDPSLLAASVKSGATGNGGTVTIYTQRLLLSEGAQIGADTFGNGNGGDLMVTATDIELVGRSGQFFSGLGAVVAPGATGNAGTVTIQTQNLRIRDGANTIASTFGNGNGGNLTINATDIVLINGDLGATVAPGATGNGGTLTINTQNLQVRDGANISASTFGNGDGGDLTVTATDIELIDANLAASVQPEATGNGGTLTIDTQRLLVLDGGQISASTFGNGNAGNLTVMATDIELSGINADSSSSSGLFTSANPDSIGQGGRLIINTDNLTIRDRAIIAVRSAGTEAAGDLIVNAPNILLDNQASLNGETTAGEGNITLNTEDLRLRNSSNITTNATGEATGGNITINTETLTALEDSDISANAEAAFGGRIIIDADGVFGTAFRTQQTQFSDITATSELGAEFSGTVELNTQFDPSTALIELPVTVVDPATLIAQEFCRQRGGSEFVNTGRGGLPPSPQESLRSEQTLVNLIELPEIESRGSNVPVRRNSTAAKTPNQAISSLDIVPARGWIRDENGDVILVSYDPTKTGVQRQRHRSIDCQP